MPKTKHNSAFLCVLLNYFDLPDSLEKIYINAFKNTSLKALHIPENVNEFILKVDEVMPKTIQK